MNWKLVHPADAETKVKVSTFVLSLCAPGGIIILILAPFSGVLLCFFPLLLFPAVNSLCLSQVRKFVSKDSAGLRVRSHPSLQSDQIGVVHVNGTITFIDEVNDWREIIPVSKI